MSGCNAQFTPQALIVVLFKIPFPPIGMIYVHFDAANDLEYTSCKTSTEVN